MNNNFFGRAADYLTKFFSFNGQLVPQSEAEASIREGVSFSGVNLFILVLAILIASLGLNTNSTAVIIGAMLISPLMGPIIGIGLGIGVHDFNLIKRCLRNLMMAALFSVIASTVYFSISPVSEGHSELLARTSPTIYDVLIGFFGGGAGILALGSRSKGNVIPGVAIATALMPPLCTAGYGIATWQLNYFFGASYLFIINSIYIALATFIGVKMLKYRGQDYDSARSKNVIRVVYVISILTMLPSIYLTYNMMRQNNFAMRVNNFVIDECRFPNTQVLTHTSSMEKNKKSITVTLIGRVLPVDSLELALQPRLAAYGLAGTKLYFIQGDSPLPKSSESSDLRDIYSLTQSTITRQQEVIDSLKMELHQIHATENAGSAIAPEIKVVFPQVRDISVSTNVVTNVSSNQLDTINVALVNFAKPMNSVELKKFDKYLCARLGMKEVTIVSAPISAPGAAPEKK